MAGNKVFRGEGPGLAIKEFDLGAGRVFPLVKEGGGDAYHLASGGVDDEDLRTDDTDAVRASGLSDVDEDTLCFG